LPFYSGDEYGLIGGCVGLKSCKIVSVQILIRRMILGRRKEVEMTGNHGLWKGRKRSRAYRIQRSGKRRKIISSSSKDKK
jgi:hypothetical protein